VRTICLAQGADAVISKRRLHQELRRGIAEVFPDVALGGLHEVIGEDLFAML
jgi:hypothetical protein